MIYVMGIRSVRIIRHFVYDLKHHVRRFAVSKKVDKEEKSVVTVSRRDFVKFEFAEGRFELRELRKSYAK